MTTDPTDGKPGLRMESAASIVLRDVITQHMRVFSHVIHGDRIASQSVVAAYIDGLAGALALTIAGGHGSVEDVICMTTNKLANAVTRDLQHLRKQ